MNFKKEISDHGDEALLQFFFNDNLFNQILSFFTNID